jgi:hypothetical protein
MRAHEFITELKRKPKNPAIVKTQADYAYEQLMGYKDRAHGRFPAGSLQLFMPRCNASAKTPYEKHLDNIGSKYRYQKDINNPEEYTHEITPDAEEWANKHPDDKLSNGIKKMDEGAPIIATRDNVPPGHNKPQAVLWTSTAKKYSDGSYSSSWVNWVYNNQPSWLSPIGYLYRVKRDASILDMNSDHDATDMYELFNQLGRGATALYNPSEDGYNNREYAMRRDFPWGEISKHFDGVHHYNYGYGNEFMYGWDCESVGWFNPAVLTLVGEVKINQYGSDPSESED